MTDLYTRAQFKAELRQLGKRQRWFAETLGLSHGTVLHWGDDRTPFPRWVPLLMAAWSKRRGPH